MGTVHGKMIVLEKDSKWWWCGHWTQILTDDMSRIPDGNCHDIAMITSQFGFVSIWEPSWTPKTPVERHDFPHERSGVGRLSWFHTIAVLAKVAVYSYFLGIPPTWSQNAIVILWRICRTAWLHWICLPFFMAQGFLVSSRLVRAHDSIQQNVLASADLETWRTQRIWF